MGNLYHWDGSLSSVAREDLMRAFAHGRSEHNDYFHLHPLHSLFSLVASVLLAGLVVLVLVESVK